MSYMHIISITTVNPSVFELVIDILIMRYDNEVNLTVHCQWSTFCTVISLHYLIECNVCKRVMKY